MVAPSRQARYEQKRHGKHQNRTKNFVNVYWPYLPLLAFVVIGLVFNAYWQPKTRSQVLPYATSMSVSDLLQYTNANRASSGIASLALNSQLNQAAQAKANDMAARNYWSHNTPDGQAPWVFIDAAGYKYQKAGENLAYGFMTSNDTVAGWMNSPPHKENLLDTTFKEVGFGFANSSDYQSSGPETIVVAMYGQALAASTAVAPTANTTPAPASQPVSQPAQAAQPSPAPSKTEDKPKESPKPVTTQQNPVPEVAARKVTRIEAFTGGTMPWVASSASMIMVAAVALLLVKHGLAVRRWLAKGERFVIHHIALDATVVALIVLCLIVTKTAGVIK